MLLTVSADAVINAERFQNEAGLAKIAAEWPMAVIVEVWNTIPGATPVTKFKDRQTGIARIWKEVQKLEAAEPDSTQRKAPEAASQPEPEVVAGHSYARCAAGRARCAEPGGGGD